LEYLDAVIGDIIREIFDNRVYCEIDPTRLENKEDVKANMKKLENYANTICKRIARSGPSLPRFVPTTLQFH
jgi:hypothetical protein